MKKLMNILCFIFMTIALQAQNPVQSGEGSNKKKKTDFYADVFGGFNLSNVSGSQSSNNSSLAGAQFGAGATVLGFSKVMSLRAELEFSMQGAKYSYSGTSTGGGYSNTYSSSNNLHLNYINVPIFGRYQMASGFYGELGIQPGFLISANESYSGSTSGNSSMDVKKYYNTFDFGIPIGIGYKFKNKIGVGVRIVPGVTNIEKSTSSYSSMYTEHNFVTTFRASYSL
jgi:Outer membrane protein beta-barrel domain